MDRRSRPAWIALIAAAALLGLGSRRFAASLPSYLSLYAGDTLWALAVFLGIGLVLPWASTRCVALLAIVSSVLVEVSQIYKAPWLDAIRRTRLGGLALGYDFVWSDLACYAVGVVLGILFELAILHLRASPGSCASCSRS